MTYNLIIGIGNDERGDDAAGLLVARKVRRMARSKVDVIELGATLTDMLDAWSTFENVYVVDCSAPAGRPGKIRRFDVGNRPIPSLFSNLSSHDSSLTTTIELARSLRRLPPRLIIYSIEGVRFDIQSKPSRIIVNSASKAARAIVRDIDVTERVVE